MKALLTSFLKVNLKSTLYIDLELQILVHLINKEEKKNFPDVNEWLFVFNSLRKNFQEQHKNMGSKKWKSQTMWTMKIMCLKQSVKYLKVLLNNYEHTNIKDTCEVSE